MAHNATGGSGHLLVVHHSVPSPWSADPRDRQVFRRVVTLSRLTGGRTTLCAVGHGPDDSAGPLSQEGIRVEHLDHSPERQAGALRDAGAVWATSVPAGLVATRSGDGVPMALDLEQLPSAVTRASAQLPSLRNSDGIEVLVDELSAREAVAVAAAAVVVAQDRTLAAEIDLRHPGRDVLVVPPTASPPSTERRFDQREGALHYGHWSCGPGHPDEDALAVLLAQLGDDLSPLTTVLSQDAPPRFRASIRGRLAVPEGHTWAAALRTHRLALVPRRFGLPPTAALVELCASTTPFLTTALALDALDGSDELGPALAHLLLPDEGEWATTLRRRASDRVWWNRTTEALHEAATVWLGSDRQEAALREVLTLLGIDGLVAGRVSPARDGDHLSTPPPTPAAGTLRSAAALDDFEHQLLGPRLMERPVYLQAQAALDVDSAYQYWVAAKSDGPMRLAQLRSRSDEFAHRPLVSIVMPTYSTDPVILGEAIGSVRAQTYENWELCIADDASPDESTRLVLERFARTDDRIKVRFLPANVGIAAASNAALDLATGDYVGFLDHDDVLAASALHWVVELLDREPDLDVVYTDEDHLDPQGRHVAPFFKPDWSPDLLLGLNYFNHLTVIRRSIIEEVGRFRAGLDGSQDHDLFLRVTERTQRVGHVAKALYGWRQIEGSTSATIDAKPEAHDAGRRAITDALERRGIDADLRPGFIPTWHQLRYRVADRPSVSVIVPTRDRHDLLEPCLTHLLASAAYEPLEIVIVDNDSHDPDTLAYFDRLTSTDPRVKTVRYPHRFNYARQMNLGAAAATGSMLLMLNNDTRPVSPGWLSTLVGLAVRPEVGIVGARLVWPDGRPQHEGIVLSVGDVAWNMRSSGLEALARNTRDTAAVTGACTMTRRDVFERVGGLDEQLRVAFNDVDFCLRVNELGYRVVYTPWAELEHAESSTRGLMHPDDDEQFYRRRWGMPGSLRDPFYNVNLDMADPVRFRV